MAVDRLGFAYHPDQPVIERLSGCLAGGRMTVLIGPNAAGKTTLLKLMLGLHRPQRGQVSLNRSPARAVCGKTGSPTPVDQLSPRQRARHLVYVPQHGSVQFAFSVREVVSMGRFAYGQADQSTDAVVGWALRVCDLDSLANKPMGELSAGQQQRVTLARALAQAGGGGHADRASPEHAPPDSSRGGEPAHVDHGHDPVVMLLDEPAGNMDLWHAHRTLALLRQWVRGWARRAVLVVLHDLNLALAWADDVWLMNHGQLQAAASWQQVLCPAKLEPIYGIPMRLIHDAPQAGAEDGQPLHEARPVLAASPSATMVGDIDRLFGSQ